MKRTNLTSVVVLMSVVSASAVSPVVAGNRGGASGGKSFGGNSGFKMQSGTSMGNVVQRNFSHAGNTGIVGKLQHVSVQPTVKQFNPQNVTTLKKFQPAISGNQAHLTNSLTKNNGINSGVLSKVSRSNVFTGNGSNGNNQNFKKSGNSSFTSKFCGTGNFNNCHKWWCSPIWWNYGCYNPCYFGGSYCNYYTPCCNYYGSYYNCSVPYYAYPVTTGVATTTTPVVVNVNASDNNQPSAASTATAKQPVETASTSNDDELREMTLGKTYDVRGTSFGETAGGLMLEVGEIALGVKVDQWTNGKISFTLPMFGLAKPMEARLHVMSTEGKPMQTTAVRLVLPAEMTASK